MEAELFGNKQVAKHIGTLISGWSAALRVKDLDSLVLHYSNDVQIFDLGTQPEGKAEYRQLWERCFPYFGDEILIERKKIRIYADDNVAFMHCYSQVSGAQTDDPSAKAWCRTTVCYQKTDDEWEVVHEHVSMPYNFESGELALILDEPR